jgi:hypothetical protein
VPPAVLLLAALAAPAGAHHSHPYFYDECRSVTIEGRLDRVEFKDPHSLLFVGVDDGTMYTVDWAGLRGLTRDRVIDAARAELVPGSRVAVTGNRIRTLAEIQKHFPEYDSEVNPNLLDPTAIRRIGGNFAWERRPASSAPDCGGK